MVLFDFTTEKSVQSWHTENDVVMGGVSQSQITYAQDAEQKGVAKFSGDVSLENGGGFAQILYDETTLDLNGFEGVELYVKGDDQTYELRFETDAERVSYAQSFQAKSEWGHVQLAFADFKATHHGNAVPDAPDLNLGAIRTVGFLIGDQQEGRFELHIGEVKAYKEQGLGRRNMRD